MQDKLFTNYTDERAVLIGEYVVETGSTVRKAAKVFGISKSTAHKDLTIKLREIDKILYYKVAKVLQKNKQERHIRGGNATKEKYLHIKNNSNKVENIQ